MPRSLNKVQLIGHMGRDADMRSTASGVQVASFSLATSYKHKDGEERTEWHRIVAWDKLADVVGKYTSKGSALYIEGRLQTREWEDKQGQKRQTTEIVATDVILLGGKGKDAPAQEAPAAQKVKQDGGSLEPTEDDLPF